MGAKGASAKDAKSLQEFFDYCRRGNLDKAQLWIQSRAKRSGFKSPLKFLRGASNAANSGNCGADEWLSCYREPSTSYTALHQAALYGQLAVAQLLVEQDHSLLTASDRRGCRPLHLAAWAGHFPLVEHLLGANPSGVNAVNSAKECALHLAAMHGHVQITHLLLQKDADARLRNARFETALDIGARTNKPDICKILVAHCPELALQSASECASVSPVNRSLSSRVVYPLHLAARYGNCECVDVLCQAGFNVNYVTDEGTALHVAASFGQTQCVAMLIQYGSNLNIRDCDGRTVLDRLKELDKQKNNQLTHVAQSAHGWQECRQLIEDALNTPRLAKKFKHLPDQIVFQMTPYNNNNKNNNENAMAWRQAAYSPTLSATSSGNVSANSKRNDNVDDGSRADIGSGSNFCAAIAARMHYSKYASGAAISEPIGVATLNSSGNDGSTVNNAPKIFPRTSANGHKNFCQSIVASRAPPQDPSLFRAPLNLYPSPVLCQYQSVSTQPAYSNVHVASGCECRQFESEKWRNDGLQTAYDNAPPSNCRNAKWTHNCCANTSPTMRTNANNGSGSASFSSSGASAAATASATPATIGTGEGRLRQFRFPGEHSSASQKEKHNERTTTMPQIRPVPHARASVLRVFAPNEDNLSLNARNDESLEQISTRRPRANSAANALTKTTTTRTTNDDNNGGGSTTTSGFSTLEKVESYADFDTNAPIAMPEELDRSTYSSDVAATSPRPRDKASNHCVADNHDAMKARSQRAQLREKNQNMWKSASNSPASTTLSAPIFDAENQQQSLRRANAKAGTMAAVMENESGRIEKIIGGSDGDVDVVAIDDGINNCAAFDDVSQPNSSIIMPPLYSAMFESQANRGSTESPTIRSSDEQIRNNSMLNGAAENEENNKNLIPTAENSKNSTDSQAIIRRNHSAEWRQIDEILKSIQRESFFGVEQNANATRTQTSSHKSDAQTTAQVGGLGESFAAHPLELWLRLNVGFSAAVSNQLAGTLCVNGFDSVPLMKGSLNRIFLTEMGIEKSIQDKLLSFLNSTGKEMIPNVVKFEYLSDWLDALELIDHLGSFATANLTHTPEIIAARLTRTDLEKMGIRSLGHIARIIRSLEMASANATNIHSDSKSDFLRFLGSVRPPPVEMLYDKDASSYANEFDRNRDEDLNLNNNYDASTSAGLFEDALSASISLDNASRRQQMLLDQCVSFSAHYLGSMEISNVEGAEDCRRAMNTSKKRVKQVNKLPQVILEISVGGVNVLDATTNQLKVQHEINRIQVVCQDELDLNCFAYIFQDGEKNFCHVYCVLTADVAKQIIVTLGDAFNLAYTLLSRSQLEF